MKKITITFALLAICSVVSFAQANQNKTTAAATNRSGKPTAEQTAAVTSKNIQKITGISDAQYQVVYNAELEYERQLLAANAPGSRNPQGAAAEAAQARDKTIKNTMTPDQYTKYTRSGITATAAPAPNGSR